MAKYEFEWTDEQAEGMQALLTDAASEQRTGRLFFNNVAQHIEEQKPRPLPTKALAVIQSKTTGCQYVILSHSRAGGGADWFGPFNGANLGTWCEPSDLPTDFEVLFEGVDLP